MPNKTKKVKLDCPLCHVFMRPVGPAKNPNYFICPLCDSMFSPYRHPDKEKLIKQLMEEHTFPK